jgi:hypothetical protein
MSWYLWLNVEMMSQCERSFFLIKFYRNPLFSQETNGRETGNPKLDNQIFAKNEKSLVSCYGEFNVFVEQLQLSDSFFSSQEVGCAKLCCWGSVSSDKLDSD